MSDEKEETIEIRQLLTDFWVDTIQGQNPAVEFPDRIKASELLAKHILGEGKTKVRRGVPKPPTRSILEEIEKLEKQTSKVSEASNGAAANT